ncbi:alpha/beta hydrolase [Shimazuella sp. AN120528]|uniref:alpha/beta hydrolase n=1 Tax=Shimazuella soli TaxID=1892854 RepID=UPI001F0DBD3B|nr:alpha/beta hydrolase [Shimazuella soli]MCH5586269.1 alpha/beta hydrolase [Shimazuella soli]
MNIHLHFVGGFGACPEKAGLGSPCESLGVGYSASRLPGHPVSLERSDDAQERFKAKVLAQCTATDWVNRVADDFRNLNQREDVDRIILAGHSMGAHLISAALKQVQTDTELQKLAGITMISTPIEGELNKGYSYFLKLAATSEIRFIGGIPYPTLGGPGSNKYVVPKGVKQFLLAMRMGTASLPNVSVPVLLFNFREDPSVQAGSAYTILGYLPDEIREKSKKIILEGPRRHTPNEEDKKIIVEETLRFHVA